MEENVKEEVKEQKELRDLSVNSLYYYRLAKFVLVILLVVALGLVCVNQALSFRYKSVLLQQPCNVCKNLNPNQSKCIDGCFTYRVEVPGSNFKPVDFSSLNLTAQK